MRGQGEGVGVGLVCGGVYFIGWGESVALPSPPLPSLLALPRSESDITKERVQKILGAGANVVLTTGGIDDLCLKYFVEAGAMAARRCKKEDLKRIAKATGGEVM